MKPRIAILAHNMTRGGAERFISHLLVGLRDEFEIHLLLFDDIIEYDLPREQVVAYVERGFQARQNLMSIARLPISSWRLKKYCKANGIELLISFLNRPNFTAGMAKLISMNIPLIISERTYTPLWFNENNARGKIAKKLVCWLYPQADIILPNSEGTRIALEEYYGIRTRYQVIRNIVDLADIERKKSENVDDVSFDRFTFIHVGSFSPMKGHRSMVEAFARLGRKDAQLLFVGKGMKFAETQELVRSMGLENDVLFLGHQSNPFKYLGHADCFVLASEFEGFPNVLTEAMACGLPVISTDCETGPRELLAEGAKSTLHGDRSIEYAEFGVLVPVGNVQALADAMRQMLEDEKRRAIYREKGIAKAADFDAGTVVEDIAAIVREQLTMRELKKGSAWRV